MNFNYTTNIIETDQSDGSTKVVLGSIIENTGARLSRGITEADRLLLIRLAEEYSAPALVEFLGIHIIAVAMTGHKLYKGNASEYFDLFRKVGLALYGSSIAVDALAATSDRITQPVPRKKSGPAKATETTGQFIEKMKLIESQLNKKKKDE